MKVYQIWYETNIGPAFKTRTEAIEFLKSESIMVTYGRLSPEGFPQYAGYPDIEEITLGDTEFNRDR